MDAPDILADLLSLVVQDQPGENYLTYSDLWGAQNNSDKTTCSMSHIPPARMVGMKFKDVSHDRCNRSQQTGPCWQRGREADQKTNVDTSASTASLQSFVISCSFWWVPTPACFNLVVFLVAQTLHQGCRATAVALHWCSIFGLMFSQCRSTVALHSWNGLKTGSVAGATLLFLGGGGCCKLGSLFQLPATPKLSRYSCRATLASHVSPYVFRVSH